MNLIFHVQLKNILLEKVYIKHGAFFIHFKLKKDTRSGEKSWKDFFQSGIPLGARIYSDRLISCGRQPRPDMTANWQLSSEIIRPRTRGESEKIRATLKWRRGSSREDRYRYSSNVTTWCVHRSYGINPRRFPAPNRFRRQGLTAGTSRDTSNDTVTKVPVLSHLATYLCPTYRREVITNGHRVSLVSSVFSE